jgi:pimeloyl-ACP methyl ester carboxylesterase
MSARISQLFFRNSLIVFLLLLIAAAGYGQAFPRPPVNAAAKPKNVHGIVQDARGKRLPGARVFMKDMKTKIVRTMETDQNGEYAVFALPPTVDYELYAQFKGKDSEKKYVSSFLNREDNVLNFQLDVSVTEDAAANPPEDAKPGVMFKSFDLVDLRASFTMPNGVPAPVPAVLLLHGYGENRSVWRELEQQLLTRGWAVLAVDLRGHGESKSRNQVPIAASPAWRSDPHEFPGDVDPALDWIKAQPRINTRKIVIIGSDVGANLALIASGRYSEVRTVVAIKPNLDEALALAGSAQDFQPRSALIIAATQAEADRIKPLVKQPARVLVVSHPDGTAQSLADKQVADAIFQWLQETF